MYFNIIEFPLNRLVTDSDALFVRHIKRIPAKKNADFKKNSRSCDKVSFYKYPETV